MGKIVVIGSANVDISLSMKEKIIWRDSNIGSIRLSPGGVGRNIAENLARLDLDTHFITPLGSETDADLLKDSCINNNVTLHSIKNEAITTSKYAALFDKESDMVVGVADTSSIEKLKAEDFIPYLDLIRGADILVLETNLSETLLKYLTTLNDTVFINAISTTKAQRIKPVYKRVHTLSLNRLEAKTLSKLEIDTETIEKVRDFFIENGVKNIVVTLGSEGAYYMNKDTIIKEDALKTKITNTSGAGDAFFSGYIYGVLKNKEPMITANALASLTLESENTVHQSLTENKLKTRIEALNNA